MLGFVWKIIVQALTQLQCKTMSEMSWQLKKNWDEDENTKVDEL